MDARSGRTLAKKSSKKTAKQTQKVIARTAKQDFPTKDNPVPKDGYEYFVEVQKYKLKGWRGIPLDLSPVPTDSWRG